MGISNYDLLVARMKILINGKLNPWEVYKNHHIIPPNSQPSPVTREHSIQFCLMYNEMSGSVPNVIADLPVIDTFLVWNNYFSDHCRLKLRKELRN
ncbi:hypothetical protein IFM89_037733 [Coptis chinensis]|uniref:Uncharacterized protein n=1 Tax=Coptis chinensis TaxID=261450 RepID=A0A835MB58_9MAGN|nr:hypothetical protein IFM89_037733 [Coptis chinensis]